MCFPKSGKARHATTRQRTNDMRGYRTKRVLMDKNSSLAWRVMEKWWRSNGYLGSSKRHYWHNYKNARSGIRTKPTGPSVDSTRTECWFGGTLHPQNSDHSFIFIFAMDVDKQDTMNIACALKKNYLFNGGYWAHKRCDMTSKKKQTNKQTNGLIRGRRHIT